MKSATSSIAWPSKHLPGVMLPRPGLLLNPWAVRDTVTTRQEAQAGDRFERLAEAKKAEMNAPAARRGRGRQAAADGGDGVGDTGHPIARFPRHHRPGQPQRRPGQGWSGARAAGQPRRRLAGPYRSPSTPRPSVARTVALPARPIATRDLRLAAGLDPAGALRPAGRNHRHRQRHAPRARRRAFGPLRNVRPPRPRLHAAAHALGQ